jgi:hypothetical protein
MKKLQKIVLVGLISAGLAIFFSCNKEEYKQMELNDIILNESEIALSLFNDAMESYDQAGNLQLKRQCPETCPLITFSIEENNCTYNVLLDFGTEGCEGRHGWLRKGKINITVSGCEQIVCIISFDQYYVDGYLLNGTATLNYNQNNDGNPIVTIEINGSVTDPDGNESTIEAELIKEWIEGYNTLFLFTDDVFSTTGNAHGICSEGVEYEMTITSPLIKAFNCKWIQEGEITLVYGGNTLVRNYGDGSCDSLATVTINGESNEIVLGHKK